MLTAPYNPRTVEENEMKVRRILVSGIFMLMITAVSLSHADAISEERFNQYSRLIQTYKRYAALEEKVFSYLTFSISDPEAKINRGVSVKLALKDQFNRPWLFKVIRTFKDGDNGKGITVEGAVNSVLDSFVLEKFSDSEKELFAKINLLGDYASFRDLSAAQRKKCLLWSEQLVTHSLLTAVPSYHIHTLFGVHTPETHYKLLNIKGRTVLGTLQRIIPFDYTSDLQVIDEYTDQSLSYLLKIFALNWLFASMDPNPNDYLLEETGGKISNVTKVDLAIHFPSLSENTAELYTHPEHQSPIFVRLWEMYSRGELLLPLIENHAFMVFVSLFPEENFNEFLLPIKSEAALKTLQRRKEQLSDKIGAFFRNLSIRRDEVVSFSDEVSFLHLIDAICQQLEKKISQLEEELVLIEKSPRIVQQEISVPILSEEVAMLISWLRMIDDYKNIDRNFVEIEASRILNDLSSILRREDNNEYEKAAIAKCLGLVEKYKEQLSSGGGEPPARNCTEVNSKQ